MTLKMCYQLSCLYRYKTVKNYMTKTIQVQYFNNRGGHLIIYYKSLIVYVPVSHTFHNNY